MQRLQKHKTDPSPLESRESRGVGGHRGLPSPAVRARDGERIDQSQDFMGTTVLQRRDSRF